MSVDKTLAQESSVLAARGLTAFRAGRVDEAETLCRRVTALQPDHFDALQILAICCSQRGDYDQALALLQHAIEVRPEAGPAIANLGNVLHQVGRDAEALGCFDRALACMPAQPELHVNRGNVLRRMRRVDEAILSYRNALALAPSHTGALQNLGNALRDQGRLEAALACFDAALQNAPRDPVAHYNRGVALKELQRWQEAARAFEVALQLRPDYAEAHHNLALAYREQQRPDEALASLGRALTLQPDFVGALVSRGHLLQALERYEDSLRDYDRALVLQPDQAGVFLTHGDALRCLGRYEEATRSYRRGLALQPDHPDAAKAHVNLAMCELLLGSYETGWAEMEWRWGDPGIQPPHGRPLDKLWLGKPDPSGRTILLHAEQGYGDALQFCRYAPMLARRGARVLLEVPTPLLALMRSLDCAAHLRASSDPEPDYELHAPLLSLPHAFGTTVSTIPAQVPYLFAPPERVAAWAQRLGRCTRRRIGIAWSGNPAHGNDAQRTLPPGQLAALLEPRAHPDIEWVSVQKEVTRSDAALLDRFGIAHFGGELRDFADTAALMMNLSLIVSVDTAPVHLAGALGRPVWVLLSHAPDWRWMLERSDCPWYPSARLFRQEIPGDWARVIQRVHAALNEPTQG